MAGLEVVSRRWEALGQSESCRFDKLLNRHATYAWC